MIKHTTDRFVRTSNFILFDDKLFHCGYSFPFVGYW